MEVEEETLKAEGKEGKMEEAPGEPSEKETEPEQAEEEGELRLEISERDYPWPRRRPQILRFSPTQRLMHFAVMVSFLGLALTGLPIKFSDSELVVSLAQYVPIRALGLIHRICALITFGYFFGHLGYLFWRIVRGKTEGMFWGPNSMVPQPKDLRDLRDQFRWFLFLGPRPRFDRWTYWEKFDYWAVFWGVTMIGSSGLLLWFPSFFAKWLPGWVFNLATIIHSEEALLAMGFIFTIHFFNTHMRPRKFPMDLVIFTGRMTEDYFREEHPEEFVRTLKTGTIRERLAPEPTGDILLVYKIVGWTGFLLGIGAVILIAIAWTTR
jgi:cytochrome b subunit of formate dehydrogenase